MASTTANRIRTSIPQHLRPMGFVPRVRNMTLDEAFIDRDFDQYDDVLQDYRKLSDEN